MKALIIAAGQGKRIRPIGDTKPLIQLLGLGLIERVILTAKKSGIKEFCIVTGYNGEKIREQLSDGKKYGVKIQYVQNDSWTQGNAISILAARDHFKESFVLLMAEQFPGVIHRMLDPKTVILIFASGKLVCTGCKTKKDVYRAVNNLHSMLEEKNLMNYD